MILKAAEFYRTSRKCKRDTIHFIYFTRAFENPVQETSTPYSPFATTIEIAIWRFVSPVFMVFRSAEAECKETKREVRLLKEERGALKSAIRGQEGEMQREIKNLLNKMKGRV